MQNESKQSAEKATVSFNRQYQTSLLSLTLLYAVTLVVILFVSGLVSYTEFSRRTSRRFDRIPPPALIERIPRPIPSADDVREDFIRAQLIVNSILLLLATALSYLLAQTTLRPIKRAYEAQQRFIADASHELRTPLSILKIQSENELADQTIPEKRRKEVHSNIEEIDRMSRLVSDLLFLSRLDDQRVPSRNTPIALGPLVERIVSQLRPLAATHTVSLSVTTTVSTSITADEDTVFRGIMNIIQNAIIYNRPHGSVAIAIAKIPSGTQITITDTGIGIDQKDIQNIFNRFYRADTSRSRATGGSGLGLAIARAAINQCGGTLALTSKKGTGTTAIIRFP